MKTLKFKSHLVKEILAGTKTVTWRLFDDKNLMVGDELEFFDSKTLKKFAEAEITKIREKKLGEIATSDFQGHEEYKNTDDMISHYREYYGNKVTKDTVIKMIDYKILRFIK